MFKYICMYVNPTYFKGVEMKPALNTKRCLPQLDVLFLQVIHIESLFSALWPLCPTMKIIICFILNISDVFFMLSPKSCVEG